MPVSLRVLARCARYSRRTVCQFCSPAKTVRRLPRRMPVGEDCVRVFWRQPWQLLIAIRRSSWPGSVRLSRSQPLRLGMRYGSSLSPRTPRPSPRSMPMRPVAGRRISTSLLRVDSKAPGCARYSAANAALSRNETRFIPSAETRAAVVWRA